MKALSNKNLVIILAGLVAVFVLARMFRAPRLESNLVESLVKTDTAAVDRLIISPQTANGESFEFVRNGKSWLVQKQGADKAVNADAAAVRSALGYLVKMVPQKVVTRKTGKYGQLS